jgi:hypothetical protein
LNLGEKHGTKFSGTDEADADRISRSLTADQ